MKIRMHNFIESFKTKESEELIKTILKGYNEIFKSFPKKKNKSSSDIINVPIRTTPFLENKKEKSEFKKLEDNKIALTDEERKEIFKKDAVWNYGYSIDPNTGKKVKKVSAVWKSKNPKTGEITYITNTHRSYNIAKSLKSIINKYHSFIKETA